MLVVVRPRGEIQVNHYFGNPFVGKTLKEQVTNPNIIVDTHSYYSRYYWKCSGGTGVMKKVRGAMPLLFGYLKFIQIQAKSRTPIIRAEERFKFEIHR
jgi:hypothetical protein